MAINGKVEIRPMMYVAVSYDHRIIDGRESVGFLVRVKEHIPLEDIKPFRSGGADGLAIDLKGLSGEEEIPENNHRP